MNPSTPPRFNLPANQNGGNGRAPTALLPNPGNLGPVISLRERLKVVMARRWTVLGIFIIVVGITSLISLRQVPRYEASCLLLIEPRQVNVSGVEGVWDPTKTGGGQNYYGTQFQLLQSLRVATRALANIREIDRDPKNPLGPRPIDELAAELSRGEVNAFRSSIMISPVKGSRLVEVSFQDNNPELASKSANAIVKAFIMDSRQRSLGLTDEGLGLLKSQQDEKSKELTAIREKIEAIRTSSRLVGFSGQESALSRQMEVLYQRLAQARANRVQVGALNNANEALIKSGHPRRSVLSINETKGLHELRTELVRLSAEWADLLRRYRRNHPYLRPYEAKLSYLKDALAEEEEMVLARLRSQLLAAESEEEALVVEVEKLENHISKNSRLGRDLALLRNDEENLVTDLLKIRKRIKEVQFAVATEPEEQNLFVIDHAQTPVTPIWPQPRRNMILGVLMGLSLGIGFAFFLEFLDTTLKHKEDVQRELELPVLGYVPRVSAFVGNNKKQVETESSDDFVFAELVALHNAGARVAEAFRTIRTGLGFALPLSGPQTLLITSASPADGKSFIATNLALSIVRTGKKTLLLDGDLRNPCLHKIMGISPDEGLSTILAHEDKDPLGYRKTIQPSIVEGLDLLPAGPCPSNPTELLQSERMMQLLKTLSKEYDWIVIDAPPMNPVADPAVLLSHVQHALFVVRTFKTTRKGARRARETLQTTPAQVLGVILNNVDVPPGRDDSHEGYPYYYYQYYSGYGYGYGGDRKHRQGRRNGGRYSGSRYGRKKYGAQRSDPILAGKGSNPEQSPPTTKDDSSSAT